MTFDQCAEVYISAHEVAWKNEKHRQQWRSTIATYASPVFGSIPVQTVDTGHIIRAIEPIWSKKTETARRLRGRIEVILNWAKVKGYRAGDNPARWRGHLSHLLPARTKLRLIKHHAALPYADIPAFMTELRKMEGTAALALEFLVLTAERTSEVIHTRWAEIDFKKHTWTIPAVRMKAGREHRVPLSVGAIAVLKGAKALDGEYIFPGGLRGSRSRTWPY